MKTINISRISNEECQGIQINGLSHCRKINCKWQGLSACVGKNIIKTGFNSKGYRVCDNGLLG
ncbi:MAG: hypothetical protein DRJ05_05860 [Bacteroidetes bacterium]|nr:MAG: hypothetical protein DRJ05_05860 [Bacteroidota bacterium]